MINFLNALGFLTVIKIPEKFFLKKEQFSKSLIYFPLIGLLVGIAISLVYVAASYIFPLVLAVILTIGFEIIFTGGLHYDGLADMFDGVFSGKIEKNKILEIMEKSDVGVFGILSIIFSIALKICFIYYIALLNSKNLVTFLAVLIFMPVFGRLSMLYLFSRYGAAKKEGSLAVLFVSENNKKIFIISAFYTIVLFMLGMTLAGVFSGDGAGGTLDWVHLKIGMSVFLFTFLFLILAGKFFTRRIDGITGDILGGICIIVEIFYLFISYLCIKFI
jgi:adenosylcobinamide-GDP ribazoletransferase